MVNRQKIMIVDDDENIAESISRCHPWAVDVSSAVETNSIKDKEKIKTFIDHVRR